jgi:hypothetical protein
MAIQPIDLQIMYSQMANIASSVAKQQDEEKLAEGVRQAGIIRQNAEQAKAVKKSAPDDAKSPKIKPDGRQNTKSERKSPEKKEKKNEEDPEVSKENEFRESYLGQHIDITG